MSRKSLWDHFEQGFVELEKMMRPVTEPVRQFLEGVGLASAKPAQQDTVTPAVAQKTAPPPSTLDESNPLSKQGGELKLMELFDIKHEGKGNTPPPPPPPPGASGAVAVAVAPVAPAKNLSHS